MYKILLIFTLILSITELESKNLKLTYPNGGERIFFNKSTNIEWEKANPSDSIKIEFSKNNGQTWSIISSNIRASNYIWKDISRETSDSCLIKISKNSSNVEWISKLDSNFVGFPASIYQNKDSSYIIAASKNNVSKDSSSLGSFRFDVAVFKTNKSGQVEWTKVFGTDKNDEVKSIIQTSDGNYVLSGQTALGSDEQHKVYPFYYYLWLMKINPKGDLLWYQSFNSNDIGQSLKVYELNDKNLLVCGTSERTIYRNFNPFIIKTNQNGEEIWTKFFDLNSFEQLRDLKFCKDNGFICCINTFEKDSALDNKQAYNIRVMKLDSSGDIEWEKIIGGSRDDYANSIIQTDDLNYYLTGYTESNDVDFQNSLNQNQIGFLMKLNPKGDIEFVKYNDELDNQLIQLKDKSLLLSNGYSHYKIFTANSNKAKFMKYDLNGNLLSQQVFPMDKINIFRDVIENKQGEIIVVGNWNEKETTLNHLNSFIGKINFSDDNEVDVSDAVFSLVDPVTSITEFGIFQNDLTISPNPSSDYIRLDLTNSNINKSDLQNIRFELMNMMGQNVLSKAIQSNNSEQNIIDIRAIPSGIYTGVIYSQNNIWTSSIVICR